MRVFAIPIFFIFGAYAFASDISECKSELTREIYATINDGMSAQEVEAIFNSHDLLITDRSRPEINADSFYDSPVIQRYFTAADTYRKHTGWLFWRTETIYFLRVGFDRNNTVVKKVCSQSLVGL